MKSRIQMTNDNTNSKFETRNSKQTRNPKFEKEGRDPKFHGSNCVGLRISFVILAGLLIAGISAVSHRSEEHTSELQSHSFISYAVFCFIKTNCSASNPFSETLQSTFSALANFALSSRGSKPVGFRSSARSMVLFAFS